MSEDNNVGKVSHSLRKKRFAEKYRHTNHVSRYEGNYDGEMWNSDDIQFLALWKKNIMYYDSFKRRHYCAEVRLSFFGYSYDFNDKRENKLSKPIPGLHVSISPEKASAFREFLAQKPTNESFIIPRGRGDYHLSFEKRSLLGKTELRWRFLNHKEEWDKTLFLPIRERASARKDLKLDEVRHRLWFAPDQTDKLIAYLDSVISSYTFLK